MDDKPPELAVIQEKTLKTLETIATAIEQLAKDIRESNEREKASLQQQMARLNSVPTQTPYLAGQFRRRDGDGFGTVPRKFGTTDPIDANNTTGDIRPPIER